MLNAFRVSHHRIYQVSAAGELFDRIVESPGGHFTEKDAAILMRQVVSRDKHSIKRIYGMQMRGPLVAACQHVRCGQSGEGTTLSLRLSPNDVAHECEERFQ